MLVATLSFLLSVTLPLYFIGHFFFAAFVLHTPMILPRRLFGLTFAASSSLLLLVLLEIWGKLEADSRLLIWRLHLVGDLVLVVLLLPYLLISLALQHATNCSVSISRWLALVLLAAWLWLFYKIGEPFPIMLAAGTSPDASAMSQGTWDWTAGLTKPWTWDLGVIAALCLSRAGVVGVTVSSVMSGIGAVYGPATSLRRLVQSVDRSMLEEAKRGVLKSVTQLAKHRLRLRAFARRTTALRRRDAEQRLITANAWSDGRWHELSYAGLERFARCALASAQQAVPLYLRSSAYREALRELRATQAEDRSRCAALRRQLIALEQILDDQQRATFAQTRRGRLFNAIGWVFSVYCVYKVVMATRSILKHSGAAAAQGGTNRATPAVPSAHSSSSLSSSSSSFSSVSTSPSSPAIVDGVEMRQELRSLGYSYVVAQLEQLVAYWHNSSHEAFVTRALGVAIRLSLLDETVLAFWSQGVSLVLIGAMTFSSVRSFLVQAARIAVRIEQRSEQRRVERLRRKQMQQQQQRPSPSGSSFPTALSPVVMSADPKLAAAAAAGVESGSSSGGGAPALADLVGCVAAELLGFYLLSSVLLMRASLPHEFRRGISEAVEMGGATIEFEFYHHFFDALFLSSAAATVFALLAQRAARRSARSMYTYSARAASARQLESERRHHYAVRASAQRQLTDRAERTEAANRVPVISPLSRRSGESSFASPGFASPAEPTVEDLSGSAACALHGGKAAQDAVAAFAADAHAVAAYGPQALIDFAVAKLFYYEGEGDEGGADKED